MMVSPDGRVVYVTAETSNSVSVIDATSDDVSVIDTRTRRVIATVPVGTGPWGLAIAR